MPSLFRSRWPTWPSLSSFASFTLDVCCYPLPGSPALVPPPVVVIALILSATMPPSPPSHYRLSHRFRPRLSPFSPLASCICGPALPPPRVLAPRTREAPHPLRATPSASMLSRTALRPSGGPYETPKNPVVNPPVRPPPFLLAHPFLLLPFILPLPSLSILSPIPSLMG